MHEKAIAKVCPFNLGLHFKQIKVTRSTALWNLKRDVRVNPTPNRPDEPNFLGCLDFKVWPKSLLNAHNATFPRFMFLWENTWSEFWLQILFWFLKDLFVSFVHYHSDSFLFYNDIKGPCALSWGDISSTSSTVDPWTMQKSDALTLAQLKIHE